MSKPLKFMQSNASNPKLWILIGVSVAGIVIYAETRRRRNGKVLQREDFGAFVHRFELKPFPQPPPPAARLLLTGLTFAVKDVFDVKDYVTGFGNPDWKRTHDVAEKTDGVVTLLLMNGAACVGKTVMDELGFGITGENKQYGTPTNPKIPSFVSGGSSSGSAVAVAGELVDFALGTDTVGCIRIPASFCGIFAFRPSHGVVTMNRVLSNSPSLDTVGWFARDPSVLHRVGHVLLKLNSVEPRRMRRLVFADDLFQLSKVPLQKTVHVVKKAIENLSGYQCPKHMNFGQYLVSKIPSLKEFLQQPPNSQKGISIFKALSSVMILLQRCEFKINHEEWIKSVKPKLGSNVSEDVLAAIKTSYDDMKTLYKVRTETRLALQNLLKDDGILVIPTTADPPPKLSTKKGISSEFRDRIFALSSISSVSGCCEVVVPLGTQDDCPISISLLTFHGADKFLLDTVLDIFSALQEQVSIAPNILSPFPDTNSDMDASELLKEKGNAAFKGRQWNKAVNYYTEAIKLNGTNATYYCNRAAAYLELGCFQQAEDDCTKAILLDKKNVKAYLRRGTARESLLLYKEAIKDFKHALVLEPQNKVANLAEKRLRKLIS
ncbi:outer envelope protein 64, mitochondrial [Cucurbita maxima]|uniref:Outer envelope protein 64, mitochondrial n=1 Tax=Cucurbita maxima TaxID=3661 RepID=A0A6J1HQ29_CUCMA|nr:outer envelope protein 64, mitochondrial [Cucurbita maxima]